MAAMDASRGGATISDAWSYRGFPVLVLENARLRVTVAPGHGAKILELSSKRAGRDLLYHHPRVDLRPPVFGANADDWWTGGIDEIAPTGHSCVVAGEQLPFLGEFWSQAWGHAVEGRGPERVAPTDQQAAQRRSRSELPVTAVRTMRRHASQRSFCPATASVSRRVDSAAASTALPPSCSTSASAAAARA